MSQKMAPKSDLGDRASDPASSHSRESSSHRRHTSKDTICDNSPWINRRVLDSHTELELRAACRLILKNFKPSDYGMENTDPKLDFAGFKPRKESKPLPADVNVRIPTGAPPEPASSTSFLPRSRSTKTRTRAKADMEIRARQNADAPARANSSRKRADFGWFTDRDAEKDEKLRTLGKASMDVARPAAATNISDEDVTLPVAVTSTLANQKPSHHLDDPVAAADAQATEWMRRELEKKQQQDGTDRQRRPSTARPPSRTTSINISSSSSKIRPTADVPPCRPPARPAAPPASRRASKNTSSPAREVAHSAVRNPRTRCVRRSKTKKTAFRDRAPTRDGATGVFAA